MTSLKGAAVADGVSLYRRELGQRHQGRACGWSSQARGQYLRPQAHRRLPLWGAPRPSPTASNGTGREIVATYDYTDEHGNLLFRVVKYYTKDFRQRQRDGNNGWIWNLEGVRRVLYRFPELVAAAPKQPVFIAEGEKDVDRLRELGLVATTNPMGANKWSPNYSGYLEGRHVVCIQDIDVDGREHVEKVANALHGIAKSVRVLELPGLTEKGADVSDWLDAGGTTEELKELAWKGTGMGAAFDGWGERG